MTKLIALINALIAMLTAFVGTLTAPADENLAQPVTENIYALTTQVVQVDYENDVVVCQDFNGDLWVFEGCEDWLYGDIASMVMNDKGTPIKYDDEIVSVRYGGWFDGFPKG